MTNNEIKAITKQWLSSKGFKKVREMEYSCTLVEQVNVVILFGRSKFSESYEFDVGFRIKGVSTAWGWVRTHVKNNLSYYYEKWDKEDYLATLEQMYHKYVRPYFDLGIGYIKNIIKDYRVSNGKVVKLPKISGQPFMIHPDAVKIINNM